MTTTNKVSVRKKMTNVMTPPLPVGLPTRFGEEFGCVARPGQSCDPMQPTHRSRYNMAKAAAASAFFFAISRAPCATAFRAAVAPIHHRHRVTAFGCVNPRMIRLTRQFRVELIVCVLRVVRSKGGGGGGGGGGFGAPKPKPKPAPKKKKAPMPKAANALLGKPGTFKYAGYVRPRSSVRPTVRRPRPEQTH